MGNNETSVYSTVRRIALLAESKLRYDGRKNEKITCARNNA